MSNKYFVEVKGFDSGLNELLNGKWWNPRTHSYINNEKAKNDRLCVNAIRKAGGSGDVKITPPIVIHYKFYLADKKHDRSNVQSAFIKSFEDALQKVGMLKNDGYKDVVGSTTDFAIDKQNPRVLVVIEEVEQEPIFWKGWSKWEKQK